MAEALLPRSQMVGVTQLLDQGFVIEAALLAQLTLSDGQEAIIECNRGAVDHAMHCRSRLRIGPAQQGAIICAKESCR